MAKASTLIEETDARIAEGIIASIDDAEARGVKWVPGWDRSAGFPSNPVTGRQYGGNYNGLVLLIAASQFGDSRFAGRSQWRTKGNVIPRDTIGTKIFFPRFVCVKCNKLAGFAKKCSKCGAQFKRYTDKRCIGFGESEVFNNLQGETPLPEVGSDWEVTCEGARKLVEKAGADVRHGGGRAFYSPKEDRIQLPEMASFHDEAAYWATSLHEHAHWTGHKTRLARPGIVNMTGFGSAEYAYEELVAEISASFLCKHAGVQREGLDDQHAAYLASWRKALSDDPSIIRKAAGEAGKVLRYLT
jgi:antirestriction protein ArdC